MIASLHLVQFMCLVLLFPPFEPAIIVQFHVALQYMCARSTLCPLGVCLCVRFAIMVFLPLGCVYPSCASGSKQHLFRGCCSSWLLFNWISSSRAKSCHLCQALLAITAGPYIK